MSTRITNGHPNLKFLLQARAIYNGFAGTEARIQILRAYITPFDELIKHIPQDASVLDVGCGAGLLAMLLSVNGHRGKIMGFDTNRDSISLANDAAKRLRQCSPDNVIPSFKHIDVQDPWPEESFDCVCLIDVLHHVPKSARANLLNEVGSHISGSGQFTYKDMGGRPRWRAFMNQLHDLARAKEWIHHEPTSNVEHWCQLHGFGLKVSNDINQLFYRHELRIFKRQLD